MSAEIRFRLSKCSSWYFGHFEQSFIKIRWISVENVAFQIYPVKWFFPFLLHGGCLVDVGVVFAWCFFEFVKILWITVDLRTEDLKGVMLWLRLGCVVRLKRFTGLPNCKKI